MMPNGNPAVVPLDVKPQLQGLCPLLLSGSGTREISPGIDGEAPRTEAYKFCWGAFEQAKSSRPARATAVWVLDAVPR